MSKPNKPRKLPHRLLALVVFLIITASVAAPALINAIRAQEAEIEPPFTVSPAELPNYPRWLWEKTWDHFGKGLYKIGLSDIEDYLAQYLASHDIWVRPSVQVAQWEGRCDFSFTEKDPSEDVLEGPITWDDVTYDYAKKWENAYGKFPLPTEGLMRLFEKGTFGYEYAYVPRSALEETYNDLAYRFDKYYELSLPLSLEDLEASLLKELKESVEISEARLSEFEVEYGFDFKPVVESEYCCVYIGQGYWTLGIEDLTPPEGGTEWMDIPWRRELGWTKEHTSVACHDSVYMAVMAGWVVGKKEDGYYAVRFGCDVIEGAAFDLTVDVYEYLPSEWYSKWALENLVNERLVYDVTHGGYIENPGFSFTLNLKQDPWDLLTSPSDVVEEFTLSLNMLLNKFKPLSGGAAPPSVVEPLMPERFFGAMPEEDSLSVASATPEEGSTLMPGSTVELSLEVEYALASADKGLVGVAAYYVAPTGLEEELATPTAVEVEKGYGTLSLELSFTVPPQLTAQGVEELYVDVELIPEGAREPTVTKTLTYKVGVPKATITYQLSKEQVVANGRDTVDIELKVVDEAGKPIEARQLIVKHARSPGLTWLTNEPCLKKLLDDYWSREVEVLTDEDGVAYFTYKAPSVVKAFYPYISKSNDPFPVYDELVVVDEATGDRVEIKVELASPYPKIVKFMTGGYFRVECWTSITIELEDLDSEELTVRLSSTIPGEFEYKGEFTTGERIVVTTSERKITLGFRPAAYGLDIRNCPTIWGWLKDQLWSAGWGAALTLASGGGRAELLRAVKALSKSKYASPLINWLSRSGLALTIKAQAGKLGELLAWGDEAVIKGMNKLMGEGLTQQLVEYINNKAADHAALLEDWIAGPPGGEGGALVQAYQRVRDAFAGDVDATGLMASGAYLTVGAAGLFGKISSWGSFTAGFVISFLDSFRQLCDRYEEIAAAQEYTRPGMLLTMVLDSDGYKAVRATKYYLIYYGTPKEAPRRPGLEALMNLGQLSSEEEAVLSTLRSFYEAGAEEDLEAFLATLNPESYNLTFMAQVAQALWEVVDTVDYELSDLEVAVCDELSAAASYRVHALISLANGSLIELDYDALAILSKDDGRWRIDAVYLEPQFHEAVAYIGAFSLLEEARIGSLINATAELPSVELLGFEVSKSPPESDEIAVTATLSSGDEKQHEVLAVFYAPDGSSYMDSASLQGAGSVELSLPVSEVEGEVEGEWAVYLYWDGVFLSALNLTVAAEAVTPPPSQPGGQLPSLPIVPIAAAAVIGAVALVILTRRRRPSVAQSSSGVEGFKGRVGGGRRRPSSAKRHRSSR